MNSETEAEIAELRSRIADLERLVWEALKYGEMCAQLAYTEWEDRAVDTETFNHIVRHRARRYLQDKGAALLGVALDVTVRNNGISMVASACQSKVFKAVRDAGNKVADRRIPAFVRSRSAREFVTQAIQPPLFPGLSTFDDALTEVEVNLLWLWEHDERHRINRVWLVKPVSAKKARVISAWQVEIPNPLGAMIGQTPPALPGAQETVDDLDDEFVLESAEEETGTQE